MDARPPTPRDWPILSRVDFKHKRSGDAVGYIADLVSNPADHVFEIHATDAELVLDPQIEMHEFLRFLDRYPMPRLGSESGWDQY